MILVTALSISFYLNLYPFFQREYLNRWFVPTAILLAIFMKDIWNIVSRNKRKIVKSCFALILTFFFIHLAASTVYHHRAFKYEVLGFKTISPDYEITYKEAMEQNSTFSDSDVLAVFYYHLMLYHVTGKSFPVWYTRMNASNWTEYDFHKLTDDLEKNRVTRIWMDQNLTEKKDDPSYILNQYINEKFEGPLKIGIFIEEWKRK